MATVIHVGLRKTGTTTLQEHVFPAIPDCVAATPESHPFRELSLNLRDAGDADYFEDTWRGFLADLQRRASTVILSREGWSAPRDPWTGQETQARTAERLHALAAEAKILVVVRHQGTMLRSAYNQYVKTGGDARFDDWVATRFDFDFLRYDTIVKCYQDLFGRERVKVMAYENLATDPHTFLGELLGFVQPGAIAQQSDVVIPFENRSLGPLSRWTFRHTNRLFRRREHNPSPGVKLASRVRFVQQPMRRFESMLLPRVKRDLTKRDRAVIESLLPTFEEGNATLEGLCGLSLRELGYPLPDHARQETAARLGNPYSESAIPESARHDASPA